MRYLILVILGLLLLAGCEQPTDSGHADHGDHGHAHSDDGMPSLVYTHFTGGTELFVEFPALVAGHESTFIAHFTRTADYRPFAEGRATVLLQQGEIYAAVAEADVPRVPGIFLPTLLAPKPGNYQLVITLESGDELIVHNLGPVTVHASHDAAMQAGAGDADGDEGIAFLKEQQWKTDFGTDLATAQTLRASVRAPATLRADTAREAQIVAPTAGWVINGPDGLPEPGSRVEAGDALLQIAPRLGGETDIAALQSAAARASANFELAASELERVRKLVEQGVLPERRLQVARSDYTTARAERDAARRRLAQYAGEGTAGNGGVVVPTPVGGEVAQLYVSPGSFVEAGDPLLYVVDRKLLWLEAHVPESRAMQLSTPAGAWFETQDGASFEIGAHNGARLVSFGARVDPDRRTVPVIFAFPSPDPRLRIGQYVDARVFTGETREGVSVPTSAVLDDTGRFVVFVQIDGEHFERRTVTLGIRDGDRVEILDGLSAGERVVTRGAYLVHLAAAAPAAVGHGHAH